MALRIIGRAPASDDAEARVVALRAAGWAAREVEDLGMAMRLLDDGVAVALAAGLDDRAAEILTTRAAVHMERGDLAAARDDLTEARHRCAERSDADVTFGEALLHDVVGDLGTARTRYLRTLSICDGRRRDVRCKALNNLGLVELRLGLLDEADRHAAEAMAAAEDYSPVLTGHAAESRATIALEHGRIAEALRHYGRAEQLLTPAGAHLTDLLTGKARTLLTLRLLDEAAAAAADAVRHAETQPGATLMLAEALIPQARVALARGRFDDAATVARRAAQLFGAQGRVGWRAHATLLELQATCAVTEADDATVRRLAQVEQTMHAVGNVSAAADAALLRGELAAACDDTEQARAAFAAVADAPHAPVLQRLRAHHASARLAELDGDHSRLARACLRGLGELSAYRATLTSAELRATAAAHGQVLADLGLRTALSSSRAMRVWEWLERARTVIGVQRGARHADEALRAMLTQLRGLELEIASTPPDDGDALATLSRDIANLEHRIRRHTWTREGPGGQPATPSSSRLRALRGALGDRTLLQYGVLDGHVVGVAVTRRRIRFADLGPHGPVADAATQLAFALRRLGAPTSTLAATAARTSATRELARLGDLLVAPLLDAARHDDEHVVAPSTQLLGLPWGALPPLADAPVRVVPSATAWHRSLQRTPVSDRVVLVAGPDVAAADEEIAAIATHHDRPERLAGADATAERLLRAAGGAGLVHVACHGRLRVDSPSFSALQLSDGPVTVHDLEQLALPAHHWILASCHLGTPGRLLGGELEGVLAALLDGGAAGVVAAVTSVPDVETRDLMTGLHAALAADASLAEATWRARRALDVTEPTAFVAATAFSCYGGG